MYSLPLHTCICSLSRYILQDAKDGLLWVLSCSSGSTAEVPFIIFDNICVQISHFGIGLNVSDQSHGRPHQRLEMLRPKKACRKGLLEPFLLRVPALSTRIH